MKYSHYNYIRPDSLNKRDKGNVKNIRIKLFYHLTIEYLLYNFRIFIPGTSEF